ncbi:sensor histidine kinase [Sphingomonas pokkalii]|uniref:histidine kinase n=1 Tax=Sphingomonas pokkalii TaxID=2175090 RepID=A0A2U0SIG1_9SPHN|nr:ATP-binding protein [Sphingomonas pokkalii]PVX31141.1 two-component sensor histidine kinase [Sphingomonas pokkalii]
MRRFLPTSLIARIALLVAAALFAAQAINFGLLLHERQKARFALVIAPATTRLADAAERLLALQREAPAQPGTAKRRFLSDPRTHVRLHRENPFAAQPNRRSDVERDLRRGLEEAGLRAGTIVAALRPVDPQRLLNPKLDPLRADRLRRMGAEMLVAVELPGKGWLTLATPWPRSDFGLIWQLAAQTLILYVVVLVPVLLVGGRIARPLRTLTDAARTFRPGDDTAPLRERGPSDVRALIAAYNALGRRVTSMLDEKDRMLGAIGHDLRTPLQALRVRIESVEDDDDRARMVDTIDEMSRTLDDILSLARLGRPSEPSTDVDLGALVDAVVEDFRDLDHDVTFEEPARLKMRLRPTLMRRAVRNLIENAVKYGDGAEVRLIAETERVTIEVCDRGPGIPAEMLKAVFNPFTRLEQSRNRGTGGIGLGLALARAIVNDAGGAIALANREGGGLVATITLPR